jgi:hypothetical protein
MNIVVLWSCSSCSWTSVPLLLLCSQMDSPASVMNIVVWWSCSKLPNNCSWISSLIVARFGHLVRTWSTVIGSVLQGHMSHDLLLLTLSLDPTNVICLALDFMTDSLQFLQLFMLNKKVCLIVLLIFPIFRRCLQWELQLIQSL